MIGASLTMVPVLEARQDDGSWSVVPARGSVELRGEQTSALRYRIMNIGDIPFRAPGTLPGGRDRLAVPAAALRPQDSAARVRTRRRVSVADLPRGSGRRRGVVRAPGKRRRARSIVPADAPVTDLMAEPRQAVPVRCRGWLPAIGVSLSAFVLFGLRLTIIGLAILFVSLLAAILIDREFGIDLSLIGLGVAIVSTTSVEADVAWPSFVRIGTVLGLAVLLPFLIDRFVFRRQVIRFPWRSHEKKTRLEIGVRVRGAAARLPASAVLLHPVGRVRELAAHHRPERTGAILRRASTRSGRGTSCSSSAPAWCCSAGTFRSGRRTCCRW